MNSEGFDVAASSDDDEMYWKTGKGLRVWDAMANQGQGPPFNASGICEYDVVLINAAVLQKSDSWVTKHR
jgi:hypothetical protein